MNSTHLKSEHASTDAGPFLNTTNGEIYVRDGAAAKSANIDITLFYSNGSYGYYFVSRLMQASKLFSKHRMQ